MPIPEWFDDILCAHSLQDLKQGISINAPQRFSRQTPSSAGRMYEIKLGPLHVTPPKLSAKTLTNLYTGKTQKPSARTIREIKNFQARINYAKLRAAGASRTEARRYYRNKSVSKQIEKFRYYAQKIAQKKGVPLEYITYGLTQSVHSLAYWETYTDEMDGSEPVDDWEDEYDEYDE